MRLRTGLWALVLTACSHHAPVGSPTTTPTVIWTAPTLVPPSPARASRSRPIRPARLTDVTCYVATGHRTASGVWPTPGMAAGNRWPLGTRLAVEGVGVIEVQDRIGHGSELDLFFHSLRACREFGRRRLHVSVVR